MQRAAEMVVHRWQNSLLWASWCSWMSHVRIVKVAVKAVVAWRSRLVRSAWSNWEYRVEQAKRMVMLASKTIARWFNRILSQSWATWHDQHAKTVRLRNLSQKSILRWTKSSLSRAWLTWYNDLAEKTRLGIIGARIVLKWSRQELSCPWYGWRYYTNEKTRLQRAANKVLQRWTNACLFPAFNSWKTEYFAVRKRTETAQKVVKRWTHLSSANAFSRWTEKVDQQKAVWELTNKVLKRWTHQGLTEAWNTWCADVAEAHRLANAFDKAARRWLRLDLSKGWYGWVSYLEKQIAAYSLEEEIRKTFVRIERAFAKSFAKWLLEQWNMLSSSKLAADYRLMGMSFSSWLEITAQAARVKKISQTIHASSISRRTCSAFSLMLWDCLQFKASHRMRVMNAFRRMRERRMTGRCVLNWFFTVKAASEEEAHLREEQQIVRAKCLAHYLSEWRIISVRQRDLRESASTIAQQWEREINLKRRLPTGSQSQPETPPDGVPNRNSAGTTTLTQTQSPTSSHSHSRIASKAMWSDMPILSSGQQLPSDLGPLNRSGLNDPQLIGRMHHAATGPYGLVSGHSSLVGSLPSGPLSLKEAFNRWRQGLNKPKLELSDLEPRNSDSTEPKPSPRTLKLKSPRGTRTVAETVAPDGSMTLKSPRAAKSGAKTGGESDGSLRGALGAALSSAPAAKIAAPSSGSQDAVRPKSPVPPLALDKLQPTASREDKTSPRKPSPRKKLLKSPRESTSAGPPPASVSQEKAKSQGFFPEMNLKDWMGGLAQAPSSQPSRDANSGWLPGWATPNSSSQPTATTQAASRVKPLPDAPGSHRVKRELVPTPRKDETQSMPQNEVKGELVPSPRKDETRSVPQSAGVQTTLDHYEKATATATAPKVGTQNPIEQHVGVGMRIQDDPPHKIISLVPGTVRVIFCCMLCVCILSSTLKCAGGPAARSGSVQVGDYLLSVQDVDIQNLSAANIRSLIVGPDVSTYPRSYHTC